MSKYRILEDGEETWRGNATDGNDAWDKYFTDEDSSSLITYEIQRMGDKKISSTMTMKDWVFVWRGKFDQ